MADSPYRSWLAHARERIAQRRQALDVDLFQLAPQRAQLPESLRRELDQLERKLDQPIRDVSTAQAVEAALLQYQKSLDVALAYAEHQRLSARASWDRRRPWLALAGPLLLGLGIVGFGSRTQAPPTATCAGGACDPPPLSCSQEPACREHGLCTQFLQEARNLGSLCAAVDDADCVRGRDCYLDGKCTASGGRCVAQDSASCAASLACKQAGRCLAAAGQCVSEPAHAQRASRPTPDWIRDPGF